LAEFYVLVRNRGSKNHVDLSEILAAGSLFLGIGLGFFAVHLEIGVFGGGWTVVILGMLIFLLGLGFRYWAIFTLGRFFVHTVVIQADHHIVRSGPYRLLRHPSYTGLMIALAGLGIALQNWLSLLALVGLPLIGILIRIKVEDEALAGALGDQYVEYAEETRRLIPGLW
jgi:protein-S-isoprenylcysteine O-methyltransferase Ste14